MATGAPGTNGVWQYGEDDSEATFSALLNKAASTTDTAIGLDRERLDDLEAKPLAGLVPVVPSSVVIATGSGSANALGQVTFTGATAVSLNNVFTSAYTNYKIITGSFVATTGATNINMRYRDAGTDNSSSSYAMGGIQVNLSTTGGIGQSNGTSFRIVNGASGVARNGFSLDVHSPADAALRTPAEWIASGFNTDNQLVIASGTYNGAAAFDGFTIFPSAGTITGTIQVFGYND
jgi:hypothetical protein